MSLIIFVLDLSHRYPCLYKENLLLNHMHTLLWTPTSLFKPCYNLAVY